MIARRASNGAARRIGPTTKPMNRSMPVHITPEMTWTKSSSQRLPTRIAATIAASAAADQTRLNGLIGAPISGAAVADGNVHRSALGPERVVGRKYNASSRSCCIGGAPGAGLDPPIARRRACAAKPRATGTTLDTIDRRPTSRPRPLGARRNHRRRAAGGRDRLARFSPGRGDERPCSRQARRLAGHRRGSGGRPLLERTAARRFSRRRLALRGDGGRFGAPRHGEASSSSIRSTARGRFWRAIRAGRCRSRSSSTGVRSPAWSTRPPSGKPTPPLSAAGRGSTARRSTLRRRPTLDRRARRRAQIDDRPRWPRRPGSNWPPRRAFPRWRFGWRGSPAARSTSASLRPIPTTGTSPAPT